MSRWTSLFLASCILLSLTTMADARWWKRSPRARMPAISFDGTDQEQCQAEANYMAAHYIYGHVGANIGHFEGVGWGFSAAPATCTPRGRMRCTGDASAVASNGMVFRVRSWR